MGMMIEIDDNAFDRAIESVKEEQAPTMRVMWSSPKGLDCIRACTSIEYRVQEHTSSGHPVALLDIIDGNGRVKTIRIQDLRYVYPNESVIA